MQHSDILHNYNVYRIQYTSAQVRKRVSRNKLEIEVLSLGIIKTFQKHIRLRRWKIHSVKDRLIWPVWSDRFIWNCDAVFNLKIINSLLLASTLIHFIFRHFYSWWVFQSEFSKKAQIFWYRKYRNKKKFDFYHCLHQYRFIWVQIEIRRFNSCVIVVHISENE